MTLQDTSSSSADLTTNGWQISEGVLSKHWVTTLRSFTMDAVNDLKSEFEEWAKVEITSNLDYRVQQENFLRYTEKQMPKNCRNYLLGLLAVSSRLDPRFCELFSEKEFIERIAEQVKSSELYFYYPPMIRFSIPGSTTSMVPAHQDSIYGEAIKHFYTLWFALVDIIDECQGMNLYDKSHLTGEVHHPQGGAWEVYADVNLDQYEKIPLRMNAGSLVIFDPYLLHETTMAPRGQHVRYSMDLRVVTRKEHITSSYWDAQTKKVVRRD